MTFFQLKNIPDNKRAMFIAVMLGICLTWSLVGCTSVLTWTITTHNKAVEVQKVDKDKTFAPVRMPIGGSYPLIQDTPKVKPLSHYQRIKAAFKKDFDPTFDRLEPPIK